MDIKDAKLFGQIVFTSGTFTAQAGTILNLTNATVLLPANAVNAATLSTFTGATANANGTKGVVPAPPASIFAAGLFLNAAGQWTAAGSGGSSLNPDIVDAVSKTDDFTVSALNARWSHIYFGYTLVPDSSLVRLASYAYPGGYVAEVESFAEPAELNGSLWVVVGKVRFTDGALPLDGSCGGILILNSDPAANNPGQPSVGLCMRTVAGKIHIVSEYSLLITDAPGDPGGFDVTLPDSAAAGWVWLKLDGYGRCFYSLDGQTYNYLGLVNYSTPVPGANGTGSVMLTGGQTFTGLYTRAVTGQGNDHAVHLDCDLFYCETHSHNSNQEGSNYLSNPMTAAGDLVVGLASGTPSRLGAGVEGYVLTIVSGLPHWAQSTGGDGTGGSSSGGTGGGVSQSVPNDEFSGDALAAGWGWINKGGTTASVAAGSLTLAAPGVGGDSVAMILQPAPVGDFSVLSACALQTSGNNYPQGGLAFYNANTGKVLTLQLIVVNGVAGVIADTWNGPTNHNATLSPGGVVPMQAGVLGIVVEGDSFTLAANGGTIATGSILATLGQVTHIGLYASGTNGQALSLIVDYFRTTATGAAGTGTAASSSATGADIAPDAPSEFDDEFNGDTLAAKWIVEGQSSAQIGNTRTVTLSKGSAIMQVTDNTQDRRFSMMQAVPSGAFSMVAKCTNEDRFGNYNGLGLMLRNTANGNGLTFFMLYNGQPKWWLCRVNDTLGNAGLSSEQDMGIRLGETHYLRADVDGTNIKFYRSKTGLSWGDPFYTEAISNFIGSITHIGLNFHPNGTPGAGVSDWFRVTQ